MNGRERDDDGQPVPRSPRVVQPRWSDAVLVCGKCLKRHPDGKAVRRALKDAVAARAPEVRVGRKREKVRLVKTTCLGLCPKRALVLASAASLSRREVVLLHGTREASDAVAQLLTSRPSDAGG